MDDKHLVEKYLNEDDEEALNELVKRYLSGVYNFIYRFVGVQSEAEDLAQETFIKLWKNLKKFRKDENFKTWLFTIARNTAFDFMRRKKPLLFSDFENAEGDNILLDTIATAELKPNEIFEQLETEKKVDDLMGELSGSSKEVVLLHHYEEMTFDQIGKVLNKPLNTVKSRYRRALMEMKKIVDSQNYAPKRK